MVFVDRPMVKTRIVADSPSREMRKRTKRKKKKKRGASEE
jgi:hypothetical protein